MVLYYFNGKRFIMYPSTTLDNSKDDYIFASITPNEIRLFQGNPSKEVPGKRLFMTGYQNLLRKYDSNVNKLPKVFNGKYDITHLTHNRYDGSYFKINYI